MRRIDAEGYLAQGRRPYMEDVACMLRLDERFLFAIVCDGHGGKACAEFVQKRVTVLVREAHKDGGSDVVARDLHCYVEQAGREWDEKCLAVLGCKDMPTSEERRVHMFNIDEEVAARYNDLNMGSGTTVVAAYINLLTKEATVANVGDSKALWKLNGEEFGETVSHLPDEYDLGPVGGVITKTHDTVRINGVLAVGRALGDNTIDLMGSVSRSTDRYSISAEDRCTRIILVSDGVTDALSSIDILSSHTAQDIVEASTDSNDNATALVINL